MLLSIGIPTYSRIDYLVNMIASVARQIEEYGLQDKVEIIISNNCSVDETEETVLSLINSGKQYIKYYKNDVNIGVVRNLLKTVEYARGKFWMFYGDDDLMCDNALPKIVEMLETNKSIPVFVFKQKGYTNITQTEQISIHDCAGKYFYYMGNACSVVNADLAKNNLQKYFNDVISTCWPQTHLMFLSMYDTDLEKPVLVADIEIFQTQVKDDNNILTAYYYYDSTFYSLIRLGMLIAEKKEKLFYSKIGKGIPVMHLSLYRSYVQKLMFLSKIANIGQESEDFAITLKESVKKIQGYYKFFALIIYLYNLIPEGAYQFIYVHTRCLYRILKGNKRSYNENYKMIRKSIEDLRHEKIFKLKKKHAVIINRDGW